VNFVKLKIMKKILILISVVFVLGFSGCGVVQRDNLTDEQLTKIAQCLSSKGVEMYGATWCGHCKKQKDDFREAFKYINYIECDPGKNVETAQKCVDDGINGVPTWGFPDGTRKNGEIQPSKLAEMAGC